MNVKVITRHGPSNYGSLLQSIATIRILERFGLNAEIIDYQRKDERGLGIIYSQLKTKKEFSSFIKKVAYIIIRYPVEKYAQVRFDKMRKSWLPLTSRYSDCEQLSRIKADIFITGSDQVWGPTMNGSFDPAYSLQFVDDKVPKIAYAASFGKLEFNSKIEKNYCRLLSRYKSIAVREDSANQLLDSWGLKNCLGQVLDPTLLFDADEWRAIMEIEKCNNSFSGNYILQYFIHNNPKNFRYAKEFAKRKGMRLVNVNPFYHRMFTGGRFVCCPTVSRFLSMIYNAAFIVTDSFHGTCFAINMNKQFIELLPQDGTSTRNLSLLDLTGLSNRIVYDYNDFESANRIIDYIPINEILKRERMKSINLFKNMLDSCREDKNSNSCNNENTSN